MGWHNLLRIVQTFTFSIIFTCVNTFPRYRVQRDIPMPLVTSGVEHGNLRELALVRLHAIYLIRLTC